MKNHKILFSVFISLAMISAGCQRAASTAPSEVIVTPSVIPTVTSNPAQILIAQTQTAAAGIKPTSAPTKQKTGAPTLAGTGTDSTAVNVVVTVTPTLASTPAPTEIKVPTVTKPVSYKLQDNEDPYCIARRFNLDIGELLSLNSLTTDSKPKTGTVLQMPATNHRWNSGARVLIQHPSSYAVRTGDTVNLIACRFGDVSPEAIIAVNNLQEPYTLSAGQVLNIP